MDKYRDTFFIEKYVALWAYGFRNGIGASEGLYRTINELGFSYFEDKTINQILDIGCGIGRTAADYAKYFKNAEIIGIDSAKTMIDMANRLHTSDEITNLNMSRLGFGVLSFQGIKLSNVSFINTELKDFSLENERRFDVVTAVNWLDRTTDIKQDLHRIFQLVKPGGILVMATPLNFADANLWAKYGSFKLLSELMKEIGFQIDVVFDNFPYQETLDARGATEEYKTIIMRLIKPI